jgi:hypothetical protein
MEGSPRLLQRTRLDDAGTCIFAAHPDYALALAAHAPKASYALQMHVPAPEYVASLAWFAEATPASPPSASACFLRRLGGGDCSAKPCEGGRRDTPDRARSLRATSEHEVRSQCARIPRSVPASQRASGPEASDSRCSTSAQATLLAHISEQAEFLKEEIQRGERTYQKKNLCPFVSPPFGVMASVVRSGVHVPCQERDSTLTPEQVFLRENFLLDEIGHAEDAVDLFHFLEALDARANRKDVVLLS